MGFGGLRISRVGSSYEWVDLEPVRKAIVKSVCGHSEAHPTAALAQTLLVAALGIASANGCTGGNAAVPDAGELPVTYTFDHGTEGWALNEREGSGFTNLGAGVQDGGSPPTVSFAGSDGDPNPGSLRLTLAFTAPSQYAAAEVVFGQARDLSDKTLHARVRLVSGPAAGVWVGLYACSPGDLATNGAAPGCAAGTAIDAAELAGPAWARLAFVVVPSSAQIGSVPGPTYFSAASVVQLGIEVYTLPSADGGRPDGATSASTGALVFEIDTVSD
ncbi:MAG: hypothetical protein JWM82_1301 [Myxococcales bacterium]|nr:hypothetical protein [Myxococcales bacterium]